MKEWKENEGNEKGLRWKGEKVKWIKGRKKERMKIILQRWKKERDEKIVITMTKMKSERKDINNEKIKNEKNVKHIKR